jgi:hypothetical protein
MNVYARHVGDWTSFDQINSRADVRHANPKLVGKTFCYTPKNILKPPGTVLANTGCTTLVCTEYTDP